MYYNDIHILWYVLIGAIATVLGQFVDYASKAFIRNSSIEKSKEEFLATERKDKETCVVKQQKIFSKETLKEYKKVAEPNYYIIVPMIISYIALLYIQGIQSEFAGNVDLIKYLFLIPILFCAFYVDLKEQIIPNRLNLILFEAGLVFAFISGMSNINVGINMFLGMLAGGGIFLSITLIGGLIAGKEAMGLRRCKVNGIIRTIFWFARNCSNISNGVFNRCSY